VRACCLCSKLMSQADRAPWDIPLFESDNFEVVPSLGSLVEGWMLLIPKEHRLCLGAIPHSQVDEYVNLKSKVAEDIKAKYGMVCAFEHGPGRANHQVGCGVDHAHLHLLPISFDLVKSAEKFLPAGVDWQNATHESCHSAWEQDLDYLYVEQPLGAGRIAIHPEFGSQIFRKAIAAQLGVLTQFNWREYPQHEVIGKTIEDFRAAHVQ
jgi:ATP adenylyltransferase